MASPVYEAANLVDAQLLCDRLLHLGISARVSGGYLSGAAGEIPVDGLVKVWIDDDGDHERAKEEIKAFEAGQRAPAWPRQCKSCGESTTSRFSHCWSCGEVINGE